MVLILISVLHNLSNGGALFVKQKECDLVADHLCYVSDAKLQIVDRPGRI